MDSYNKLFDKSKAVMFYFSQKKDLSLYDKYLYELAGLSVSIIHEDVLKNNESELLVYSYQSVIEILSLISMEKDSNLADIAEKYKAYTESDIYLKYQGKIKDSLYHFEKPEAIYNTISDDFSLFHLNQDLSDIVKKYHPEFLNYYQDLKDGVIDGSASSVNAIILVTVYMILMREYPTLNVKKNQSLDYEKSFFINHPLSQRYLTYVRSQMELLNRIPELKKISDLLMSFSTGKLYLYTESFEIRFKVFADYLMSITGDKDIHSFMEKYAGARMDYMKLVYEEASRLNHRAGYMIHSFIDSYQEYSEATAFFDDVITKIISEYDVNLAADYQKLADEKYRFDYENEYLVDKKEPDIVTE